jgi:hypothetical protein
MGGLLALGAYTDPLGLDSPRAQRDLKTGRVRILFVFDSQRRLCLTHMHALVQSLFCVVMNQGSDIHLLPNVCSNGDWHFCRVCAVCPWRRL